MYKIKLVVNNNERWITGIHYEYFYPVKINNSFYQKFLYKNFPYKPSDEYDLFPYNKQCIPSIKLSNLDKKIQKETLKKIELKHHQRILTNSIMKSCITKEALTKKEYYNELAMARHKEGLDNGMAPNYTSDYDKYIKPTQNLRSKTENIVVGGIFNLELDSSNSDDYLYEWMLSGTMTQGKLVFYDEDLDICFKIEFWDCYCIGVGEHMTSEENTPMKLKLRLSPAITRNRGAEHKKNWKITDLTQNRLTTPNEVAEEEEVIESKLNITQLYWTDMDGNRLYGPQKGNNLLVVHSNDGIGKSVSFNLKSSVSYNYKYLGVELEDDKLNDYTINTDIDKLKIEAF